MTAVLESILTTVQSQIQALSLSGISSSSIVIRSVPIDKDLAKPYITISPFGSEQELLGTNSHDDIGYPILVATVASAGQSETDRGTYLQWRESIRSEFINQRLSTYAYGCKWEPLSVVEAAAWKQLGIWVSGQVFRFFTRETRG